MQADGIPYRATGYFPLLICDYLDRLEDIKPFYNRFPSLENFAAQIKEKSKNFPLSQRQVLANALTDQYESTVVSKKTKAHIDALKNDNTFTIVTGHQLNLFTGPTYFVYKIISAINLCESLKKTFPQNNFVPVYWMASEDHDFEEINYFNFQGQKIRWERPEGGAVGRMETMGLEAVFDVFSKKLGNSKNAVKIKDLFRNAYLEHSDLTSATRYLVNALFGDHGLVIIDGDDVNLKQCLVPYIKKDIFEGVAHAHVTKTIAELKETGKNYSIQVNPREINYFYLQDGLRERIIERDGQYIVNNTNLSFDRKALEKEMDTHPERFSPNVIARPLYQEIILPNLCYIGGGGEISYWLELRHYFKAVDITFPILLLRNSALIVDEKEANKIQKLDLTWSDLFLTQNTLINKKIRQISNIDINFDPQKKVLETQFTALYELAKRTDASFLGAVKAQEKKQKNGLDHLEKRLLKAQKRVLKDQVSRMTELQNTLFPNYSLQERQLNFSELFLKYGEDLIPQLKKALQPLNLEFSILRY